MFVGERMEGLSFLLQESRQEFQIPESLEIQMPELVRRLVVEEEWLSSVVVERKEKENSLEKSHLVDGE